MFIFCCLTVSAYVSIREDRYLWGETSSPTQKYVTTDTENEKNAFLPGIASILNRNYDASVSVY